MQNDPENTFARAMMTGLFIGIIDTLVCLGYNMGYRDITGYQPSSIINVSSLIFGVNLLLLIAGIFYFFFYKLFGQRDIVFVGVFLVLTVLFLWKAGRGHRFGDNAVNIGWKGLISGIVLVLGLSAASIPLCLRSRFFDKYVL
jgi:hypothetical protein